MTNVSSLFLSDHLPVTSIGGLVCVKLFGGELGNEATYVSTTNECFSPLMRQYSDTWGGCCDKKLSMT